MHRGINFLSGAAVLGLGLTLVAPAVQAAPVSSEKSLLGVRILQTYKEVLRILGQPTRVYRFNEYVAFMEGLNAEGLHTGTVTGLGEYVTDSASAGGPGGSSGGSGAPSGYPGSSGSLPGFAGPGASQGGSGPVPPSLVYYDFAPIGTHSKSKGSASGGSSGGGYPGGSSSAGGGSSTPPEEDTTFGEAGGFIWIYYYPKQSVAYIFVFNGDQRVETIIERGRTGGLPTQRGVGLGASVRGVYTAYGWPDSVEDQITEVALNYNEKYHVQFSTLAGRVVGIAVFLKEDQRLRLFDPSKSKSGGGGSGSGGSSGGGPGPAIGGSRD